MNSFLPFLLTGCALASAIPLSAEKEDLLRLKNGDTTHGRFLSLDEGPIIQWQSSEAIGPTAYRANKIRKLVFNGGRTRKLVKSSGHVTTTGGDLFPGTLRSIDAEVVTLETAYSGLLTFPRNQVTSLYPSRVAGEVSYAGPFSEEKWRILESEQEIEEAKGQKEAEDATPDPEVDEALWRFGNGAWYSNSGQPLCLQVPLPDRVSIRFQLAWQNQLHASFGLMTDFQRPLIQEAPAEDEEENVGEDPVPAELERESLFETGTGRSAAENFGSGFVIDLHNNYSRMQRLSFDDDGRPRARNFPTASGRAQLTNSYSAEVEIRCDRPSGKVAIFIDGSFYAEWQDEGEVLSDSDRYFSVRPLQGSNLQVTDIVVSEWNGMPDAARSMETEERDILLLTNGTDRISGEIVSLSEEVFAVKTTFGDFNIPAANVSEVHFATASRAEAPAIGSDDILLYLEPLGRITLSPHHAQGKNLNGTHPVLDELNFDLDFCYLLEFDPQRTIFDNWDDDF